MSVPGPAFAALHSIGEEVSISPDRLLWREGDPANEVVLLLEGIMEVTHEGTDGEEIVLRTLEPGAVLGEIATLDGLTRSAAVKAVTSCRILRIPAPAFRDAVHAQPELLEALFWQQVGRVRSLTERVIKTHRASIIDRLTRAYNVEFFRQRLRAELERAQEAGDAVAIAIFDLDHLATYNETQGRLAGHDLLVRTAELIRACGRRGDVVARFTGGKFAIILYGGEREDGVRFAEKVRQRMESTVFPGGEGQPLGKVTLSGGVAAWPADAPRADSLEEAAELGLALAKEGGRNRVVAEGGTRPPE